MIRLVENNDWVVFVLLCVASVYATLFRVLNKNQSFLEYMKLSAEYGGNILMNWIISGVIYVLVISVLLFNYIHVIPSFIIKNIVFFEYSLNEFGFIFIAYSIFYMVKGIFSHVFFIVTGNRKRWRTYLFTINKIFYFSILLMCILIIVYYFYPINKDILFKTFVIFFIIMFLFKIIFLFSSSSKALPREWYYKFLYICTLQVLPHLAMWWFLFFQYYR